MEDFIERVRAMAQQSSSTLEGDTLGKSDVPVAIPTYASSVFALPIEYVSPDQRHELNQVVVSDLELAEPLDETMPSMYQCTFQPETPFAHQVMTKFKKYYTTDVVFLEDSQKWIQSMDQIVPAPKAPAFDCNEIMDHWTAVKHDPHFMETYGYLDWSILKPYNTNSFVMQSLTLANMLSPLMSFFIPILFLLFPFVILKIQGIPISLQVYFQILKEIAKNHFIGQALSTFESFSMQKLIYLIVMLGLYGFQMYQNTMQCLRFYRNVQKMNTELKNWKTYFTHSTQQMERVLHHSQALSSYSAFRQATTHHLQVVQSIQEMLSSVQPFSCSITKTTEIGYMLKCYYELHTNAQYEESILYCMGLDGYVQLMYGVHKQWKAGHLNCAELSEDTDETDTEVEEGEEVEEEENNAETCQIVEQYYPPHLGETVCVKNNVKMSTYGVITGPNASGKTTFLKTTAINVILTQQLGLGFYSSCKLNPYHHIHSYLNIPDTSGRDSLFQAESRRCKQILENMETHKQDRHFCIFDELYSGTNPKEATQSAYAFMEYLRQYSQVDLFLTTHYVSICDSWEKEQNTEDGESKEDKTAKLHRPIQNYRMVVNSDGERNIPTYKMEEGISRIEGAFGILKDMDYPEEMLSLMRNDEVTV